MPTKEVVPSPQLWDQGWSDYRSMKIQIHQTRLPYSSNTAGSTMVLQKNREFAGITTSDNTFTISSENPPVQMTTIRNDRIIKYQAKTSTISGNMDRNAFYPLCPSCSGFVLLPSNHFDYNADIRISDRSMQLDNPDFWKRDPSFHSVGRSLCLSCSGLTVIP